MSNQKFNALEVSQKKVLLEKFANSMALIVSNRGVMDYAEAKKGFLEFCKGFELKNFPFSHTKYEDAWDVFLKGHYQEEASLKNMDLIIANLHDLQSCNLLEKKLNERKKFFENGEKKKYYEVYLDECLGVFTNIVEATKFLTSLVELCVKEDEENFYLERISIYLTELYDFEYKKKLKDTRNNDLKYALIKI